MLTVGKKCSECGKIHLVKSMDTFNSLEPRIRARAFKTEHRLWKNGYLFSLNMNMDSETWEIYDPLTVWKLSLEKEEEEKETKFHCRICGKSISEEEYEEFQGYHRNCFYLEEIQDSDDK